MRFTPQLPELQDACDIPCGENPPHIVKVTHVQTPIWAAGQSYWGQQLVSVSQTVTAGAGDAPPAPIPHHAADYRRLLGDEDVLAISHVKNAWWGKGAGIDWKLLRLNRVYSTLQSFSFLCSGQHSSLVFRDVFRAVDLYIEVQQMEERFVWFYGWIWAVSWWKHSYKFMKMWTKILGWHGWHKWSLKWLALIKHGIVLAFLPLPALHMKIK